MAKGTVINPLFIFDGKYRRNMGEYFILSALMTGAILVGFLFGIIPGFVISVAWSFAVVLFVDKDMSAMDALHESNRLTYGHKWRIFGTEFLLVLCLELVIVIIQFLFGIGEVSWLETIGKILIFILTIFAVPAILGVEASIYKQLTSASFLGDTPAAQPAAEAPASAPQPTSSPASASNPPPSPAPAAQPAAESPAFQPAADTPAAE
jgi:membrane-anchored glycerophosphoryl diester phosphodiesterase (GDPDase)